MKAWRVRLAGYVERMGEKRNVYMGFFGPGGGGGRENGNLMSRGLRRPMCTL